MAEHERQLVLVVDDDPKIVALLSAYLSSAGFEVATAGDGLSALRIARASHPSLIVLDLMLPRLDGISVTRLLREESNVPIIMLTARSGVRDRLAGFGQGADDYLIKPFAPSELVARVNAILRRARPLQRAGRERGPRFRLDDLVVDAERLQVSRNGDALDLSLVEFRLLEALAVADGRVLTRDRLLDLLGGEVVDAILPRSVDVYVSRLRQKLGDDPDRPRYVATVRGAGYRAASPVLPA